jgi:predicted helicase
MDSFEHIIQKYRDTSFSGWDKGCRFERLIQSFPKTYPLYGNEFTDAWLRKEFPSIALPGQTLREWPAHARYPVYPICICSDAGVSKPASRTDDVSVVSVTEEVKVTGTDKGNFIVSKMNFPAKAYEYIVNGKPAINDIGGYLEK